MTIPGLIVCATKSSNTSSIYDRVDWILFSARFQKACVKGWKIVSLKRVCCVFEETIDAEFYSVY